MRQEISLERSVLLCVTCFGFVIDVVRIDAECYICSVDNQSKSAAYGSISVVAEL